MEELNGYVKIDGKKYPFAFCESKLKVYPNGEQQVDVDRDEEYDELVTGVYVPKTKRGEVIEEIEIAGTLVDSRDIIFKVYNNPNKIGNFCSYTVISYLLYKHEERHPIIKEIDGKRKLDGWKVIENKVDGIIITGQEIDYFYDPAMIFEHKYKIGEDNQHYTEFNVRATVNEEKECGVFRYGEIECHIYIRSIAKVKTFSNSPFNSYSEMVFLFSEPLTYGQVEDIFLGTLNCFRYLCRRSNIEFSNVELFCKTDDEKRRRFGIYKSLRYDCSEETNSKASGQIIAYELVGIKFGYLIQEFIDDKMYLNHLPNNFDADHKFGPERMIFDFVAFEREYQNLYPETVVRSEEFISIKEMVLQAIDELSSDVKGKKKKSLSSIKRSVSKIENSLGDRIKYVIEDCNEIMMPFLIYNYCKDYGEDVEQMCDRMNDFRNDCAHGNIMAAFEGTLLIDYNTLECLLYAMRLKALGISTLLAQKAIAKVMNINMYIPDEQTITE